jgi:hypothetical protein
MMRKELKRSLGDFENGATTRPCALGNGYPCSYLEMRAVIRPAVIPSMSKVDHQRSPRFVPPLRMSRLARSAMRRPSLDGRRGCSSTILP